MVLFRGLQRSDLSTTISGELGEDADNAKLLFGRGLISICVVDTMCFKLLLSLNFANDGGIGGRGKFCLGLVNFMQGKLPNSRRFNLIQNH